jgi:hypothetical protein
VKGANLMAYIDDGLRLAVHRSVAIETARGWKISKTKASHRIDLVVALAMAALGATRNGQAVRDGYVAARNLGRGVRIPEGLTRADEEDAIGYAREEREREARSRAFFDDCGPFVANDLTRRW